jgi:hypothetical protein
MDIAGYVTVCVQLYCVVFHCLSLHVSAYMAIFKCVGYLFSYAWRILLRCFFPRGHTLHVFRLCFVPVLFSFVIFVVSLRVCLVCLIFLCCLFVCPVLCTEAESFEHMKINILHTWRWPCRPKHVVKDSENQHNKAACRRKHNLQYPLNNTVHQDAKI